MPGFELGTHPTNPGGRGAGMPAGMAHWEGAIGLNSQWKAMELKTSTHTHDSELGKVYRDGDVKDYVCWNDVILGASPFWRIIHLQRAYIAWTHSTVAIPLSTASMAQEREKALLSMTVMKVGKFLTLCEPNTHLQW